MTTDDLQYQGSRTWIASPRWKLVLAVTSIVASVWLLGTATFLFDADETRFVAHANGFGVTHNCLTGYVVAAHLATANTPNIYDRSHYRNAEVPTPIHEEVEGTFTVDAYHYPPPFLTLPYLMYKVFGDFFSVRGAWFVLTLLLMLGASVALAHWCGAFRAQNRLLIFPLLFCAPTMHIALQFGNAHVLVVAMSVLAMVAFEKRHVVAGGALLGFAIAAKIWPGVLVVLFLLQRRWKPALACFVAVAIYALGAYLIFGPDPYKAFVGYQIPRISSGEAFPIMAQVPRAIMINMSVFGIPHKLHALDLIASKPALISPTLNWVFTGLIGVLVIAIGLRQRAEDAADDSSRLAKAQLWLALLTLVQLRSPFLPWQYGVVSTLWLLIFLSASVGGWRLGLIFVAWLYLSINIPPDFLSASDGFHVGYTLVGSLLVFGVVAERLRAHLAAGKGLFPRFGTNTDSTVG